MKSKLFSYTLLAVALFFFFLAGFALWERYYSPDNLSFLGYVTPSPPIGSAAVLAPVTLELPSQNISLPVFPAEIKSGRWPATPEGVSHLSSSAGVGQGNTVIYGHNWPRLLGKLAQVQVGDMVTLTTQSNLRLDYQIDEIKIVAPNDISVLESTLDAKLTLYTCTGFLDTKRLVIVASPRITQ